jgi:hypothetical protein
MRTHLRLLGLSPRAIYGETREGRGPRARLASRVLFFAGLALLLSGWFIK